MQVTESRKYGFLAEEHRVNMEMSQRFPFQNRECERFLALRALGLHEYMGLELPHDHWQFDDHDPELSIEEIREAGQMARQIVEGMRFLSPPVLWHSNSRRSHHWGRDLIEGNLEPWRETKRYSSQFSAMIFYPSKERAFDFLLCINRYMPIALTRILDVRFHDDRKLKEQTHAARLEFECMTSRPMLLRREPRGCAFNDVRNFVADLGQLKETVGCSIRDLGECSRFI